MRPPLVNPRRPGVVSVRVDRANGQHVLLTYRGMKGPLQSKKPLEDVEFPLIIVGATITGWQQITTNTVGISFDIDVKDQDYYYINESTELLAYGNLPIQGKRGKVR